MCGLKSLFGECWKVYRLQINSPHCLSNWSSYLQDDVLVCCIDKKDSFFNKLFIAVLLIYTA